MGNDIPSANDLVEQDVGHIIKKLANHFRGRPVTPEAVLYPNAPDVVHRFHALTSAIDWNRFSPSNPVRILDVGCGPAFLLDYWQQIGVLDRVSYLGTDLNEEILFAARSKYPNHEFRFLDVRKHALGHNQFDVAILCGIFTARFTLDRPSMVNLMEETLLAVWPAVNDHLVYNVMSTHVDWERDDLFHISVDEAIAFAKSRLGTRQVRILHDYGLYEYACLIFREPNRSGERTPAAWIAS